MVDVTGMQLSEFGF